MTVLFPKMSQRYIAYASRRHHRDVSTNTYLNDNWFCSYVRFARCLPMSVLVSTNATKDIAPSVAAIVTVVVVVVQNTLLCGSGCCLCRAMPRCVHPLSAHTHTLVGAGFSVFRTAKVCACRRSVPECARK